MRFNGERIKLYDNNKLTIVDAALQAGFPNEQLFPRRGRALNFSINGKKRIVRGGTGESAIVSVNGRQTNINAPLEANSNIVIEPSTIGEDAVCLLEDLEEYGASMLTFEVNGRLISCPKFADVNGRMESPNYMIQEDDQIEMCSYYTVAQIIEFMDVEIDMSSDILVNNRPADLDTLVYENFSIEWNELSYRTSREEMEQSTEQMQESEMPQNYFSTKQSANPGKADNQEQNFADGVNSEENGEQERELTQEELEEKFWESQRAADHDIRPTIVKKPAKPSPLPPQEQILLQVIVNKRPVVLTGKKSYVFVDVFDAISFDLNAGNGRSIVTKLNGETTAYTALLQDGDVIEIYWED